MEGSIAFEPFLHQRRLPGLKVRNGRFEDLKTCQELSGEKGGVKKGQLEAHWNPFVATGIWPLTFAILY